MMKSERWFSFLLYLLGFLLLWEWLLPLEQITQTSKTEYFIIFILISLLLNFFKVPWFISWPVKGAFVLYALFSIFSEKKAFHAWVFEFVENIAESSVMVLSGNWLELSGLFRSLLCFVLLWQITYLLRYWLMVKKKIFVFYLMTIFFITVLDTFTEYSAEKAIVRIVLIGFTLLGLLFFQRMLDKEGVARQGFLLKKWLLSLTLFVGAGVFIGYAVPKTGPIWPDPVPYIETKAVHMKDGGLSKVGYGADDSRLGGPFANDDRVVFTVRTPKRQYWKIESKDMYTGKGWVASNNAEMQPIDIQYGEERNIEPISINVEDPLQVEEATFDFEMIYPHIVRPYGFLLMESNGSGGFLRYDQTLDKISSYTGNEKEVRLNGYAITYQPQAYSMKELRETTALPSNQYSEIQEQYTQLPDTLPQRVRDLAKELTDEYGNWFDKAKAIEMHFQTGEFVYDQTRVGVPAENEDYVDQFLFDTKRGYCDNFSTSMVTMLRAANIPARWAKGYAPGNYKGHSEDDERIYEVTNNEAHSWVEVFFPTQGWVPFEPTKGFNNPTTYIYDEETGISSPSTVEQDEEEPSAREISEDKDNISTPAESVLQDMHIAELIGRYWKVSLLMVVLFIGAPIIIYMRRSRWIPHFLIFKYKRRQDEEAFIEAYGSLLKQLERIGLKRKKGQTLRSYAASVDEYFDGNDMTLLTELYERAIYRRDGNVPEWEYSKELWENLIMKTLN